MSSKLVTNSRGIDGKQLEEKFWNTMKRTLTIRHQELLNVLLSQGVFAKFKTEFAASKVHDAQKHGLMHHTLKMVDIYNKVKVMYPKLYRKLDNNFMVIAIVLHDVGKIYEYEDGKRTKYSYGTHHLFGIEIIHNHKDYIISRFGEDFYYRLQSVILQHHGEFGERPQTIEAYVIHLIDMLESRMQMLEESLPIEGDYLSVEFGKFKVK